MCKGTPSERRDVSAYFACLNEWHTVNKGSHRSPSLIKAVGRACERGLSLVKDFGQNGTLSSLLEAYFSEDVAVLPPPTSRKEEVIRKRADHVHELEKGTLHTVPEIEPEQITAATKKILRALSKNKPTTSATIHKFKAPRRN